ncbi:peptidoglycan DD-metalloendopeptidase family protein [Cytobacillus firmus]|uniref:murein hydrolase activator EnvC family protein n=1 Tax=Cytobacillus TaxID=2675230 RepID=UPI001C239088|nr:peptidoglycan DD-metalloendopeptidase family protein [Cytobacillus oceanisediminis]MBU8731802.1 peptidoglycan DD-metalloendopeptidase family protein [Cytobacillus oceanisediminis]MCM3246137.1 peptidoglycan DD-metalloendopeptidase family protein [Cytobacillus oceanisediminis]MCS0827749.1 peptidoglycan DD-metalloendopeptidase family protein [Cytobacillus firmus]
MKKSIITLSLAAILGFGSATVGLPLEKASAENKLNDLNSQKDKINQQRSGVESKITDTDKKINENQGEQQSVQSEIERLDKAISDALAKIEEKNGQIAETKKEIEKLEAEIEILVERIKKRNELLKDRARNYQETGGMVSYIDVLMGAQSFGDFVERVGAVATIVEADQDILKAHQADKDELEKKQAQVKEELASLEKMRAELEGMKKSLNAQKAEKDKLLKSLKHEEEEMHAHKLELAEENEILAAQEAAIQKAIKLEQERQAEAARQAELAKQKAAQEAAKKSSSSSAGSSSAGSSSSSDSGSSSSPQVTPPSVSSGAWTKPAAGRLSSGFGGRSLGEHYGVDIAAGGTVPIVAAADGVVIRSYYSSSYGNAIFIAHSIGGQTYTTVYAHMRSRSVGSGQTVSKGQQIGIMGNTGQSYGQHLHFELHRGSWNAAKSNAINPVGIVPL